VILSGRRRQYVRRAARDGRAYVAGASGDQHALQKSASVLRSRPDVIDGSP
jgi:hypothetical protein